MNFVLVPLVHIRTGVLKLGSFGVATEFKPPTQQNCQNGHKTSFFCTIWFRVAGWTMDACKYGQMRGPITTHYSIHRLQKKQNKPILHQSVEWVLWIISQKMRKQRKSIFAYRPTLVPLTYQNGNPLKTRSSLPPYASALVQYIYSAQNSLNGKHQTLLWGKKITIIQSTNWPRNQWLRITRISIIRQKNSYFDEIYGKV